MSRDGVTVIVVTHSEEYDSYADTRYWIKEGRLINA